MSKTAQVTTAMLFCARYSCLACPEYKSGLLSLKQPVWFRPMFAGAKQAEV
jgi:hypothetical protein